MRTVAIPNELFANGVVPALFNDFFGDLLPRNVAGAVKTPNGAYSFPLDIEEREGGFAVVANLPGVAKEAIAITVEDDRLTIDVSAKEQKDEKKYLYRERRAATMSRTVQLKDASPDAVEATLQDGVLTVLVKKDEKRLPKRIEIR